MGPLRQQRGASRDGAGDELRDGDHQVGEERGVDGYLCSFILVVSLCSLRFFFVVSVHALLLAPLLRMVVLAFTGQQNRLEDTLSAASVSFDATRDPPWSTFLVTGGYILGSLGHPPEPGDTVEVDGITLDVKSVDGPRVSMLTLRRRDETDEKGGS